MAEQDSILKLNTDIQTLKIKDEYRTKELDALMKKLDASTSNLNSLSENIGRLLAAQDVNKMTDNGKGQDLCRSDAENPLYTNKPKSTAWI